MANVDNVVLIGFMGAGKTSVGKLLADMLHWKYIDTDDMIEAEAKKKITEIFAEDGEPAFRDLETEMLHRLTGVRRHIIATGGGIVMRPENRELIDQIGLGIYLKAGADTIYSRIASQTHRPLLNVEDPRARIDEILAERREVYESSKLVIETDDKSVKKVAATIAEIITQRPV